MHIQQTPTPGMGDNAECVKTITNETNPVAKRQGGENVPCNTLINPESLVLEAFTLDSTGVGKSINRSNTSLALRPQQIFSRQVQGAPK